VLANTQHHLAPKTVKSVSIYTYPYKIVRK